MATNNATNTSNPITVAQGGTGDSSLTAYAVLCGGTTSTGAVQSIASVGTSGQVLTSNGAAALPTFQAAASGSASGTPVQQKRTVLTTKTSTSTSILSTTTPTTANTVSLMSVSVTPTNSSNTLIFQGVITGSMNSPGAEAIICLFAGTTLLVSLPFSAGGSTDGFYSNPIYYEATAGTTSATTYAVYYAVAAGSGTVYINQDNSGNAFGNSMKCTFTVTEVLT